MRTLKKSLCLILALVFVLGLCTIGAGAAFTDAKEINYDSAVTVMNGLGILTGYPDGSFKPGDNVTRAEAAAMITRMMLGPENADKLPLGDVKFSDVPDSNWAAKYISFCANKGIIVGMGDGTFRPTQNVTGTQLATMLLRAVGYGTMGEYEGKGWDINSVADALYYKIFEDSEVKNFDQAATREECALYVFNTLWRVDQVKWDVDVNRYMYYADPFGGTVFDLVVLTAADDDVQVLANKTTLDGIDYTLVRYTKGTSKVELYLDYETGLDMIAHEADVYFRGIRKEDKTNHIYYYECYLIDDQSAVLDKGTYYNDFYRNLLNANRANANKAFSSFAAWTNYDYTNVGAASNVLDYDLFYKGDYANMTYYNVNDLKGQRSSNDQTYYISGTYVLDHEGKVLTVLKTSYDVGKVTGIDEYGITVKKSDNATEEVFEAEYAYEGIKKNDYVVIQPQGELTYLYATTTKTVEISQRTAYDSINTYYFNNFSFYPGSGTTINITDKDEPADVRVGDTVKFYLSYDYGFLAYYFGLQIVDAAELDGIVFLNYVKKTTADDEWGSSVASYKVQAVTEAGDIVSYKISKDEYNNLGGDGTGAQGVYKAYKKASGYTVFKPYNDDGKYDGEFTKTEGRNSFLKRDGGTYYVVSDTTVCYLTTKSGYTQPVGSGLKVTTAKKLKNTGSNYPVFASYRSSGGSYNLRTVWIVGTTAPEDYEDEYVFIYSCTGTSNTDPTGYKGFGSKNTDTAYYTLMIEGEEVEAFISTADANLDDETLATGFYKYNIDKDGVYELTKVAASKVQTDVLSKGGFKNGKLYADYADGVTVKNSIVDVSGDTTIDTMRDAAVNSLERLEELLDDGYTITIQYIYKTSSGNRVPTGTIYVTSVIAP